MNPRTAQYILRTTNQWAMHGTTPQPPHPGMIIAFSPTEDEHPRPWRILDITTGNTDTETWVAMHLHPTDTDDDREDVHYGWSCKPWETLTPEVAALDEHHPTCSECGHLTPCPDLVNRAQLAVDLDSFQRFTDPTACAACGTSITEDNKQATFATNLHGTTPVSFHLTGTCLRHALAYDKELIHHGHSPQLHCSGVQYAYRVPGEIEHHWCQHPTCKGHDLHHALTHNIDHFGDVPRNYTHITHTAH